MPQRHETRDSGEYRQSRRAPNPATTLPMRFMSGGANSGCGLLVMACVRLIQRQQPCQFAYVGDFFEALDDCIYLGDALRRERAPGTVVEFFLHQLGASGNIDRAAELKKLFIRERLSAGGPDRPHRTEMMLFREVLG